MTNVFSKQKVLLSDIYNNKEAIITASKEAVRSNKLLFEVCVKKKGITFVLSTCFCSSAHALVPSFIGAKSVDIYESNLSVMGGSKNELFYAVYYKGKPFMVLTVGFAEVGFMYEEKPPYVEPVPVEQKVQPEEETVFWFGSGKPMVSKKLEQHSLWGAWPMQANYRLTGSGW
jgi:hypothetical protein